MLFDVGVRVVPFHGKEDLSLRGTKRQGDGRRPKKLAAAARRNAVIRHIVERIRGIRSSREGKSNSFSTGNVSDQGKEQNPKSRPKPGAALAQAKRETPAIVPSQGRRLSFDGITFGGKERRMSFSDNHGRFVVWRCLPYPCVN
jgi:hypothetical protein